MRFVRVGVCCLYPLSTERGYARRPIPKRKRYISAAGLTTARIFPLSRQYFLTVRRHIAELSEMILFLYYNTLAYNTLTAKKSIIRCQRITAKKERCREQQHHSSLLQISFHSGSDSYHQPMCLSLVLEPLRITTSKAAAEANSSISHITTGASSPVLGTSGSAGSSGVTGSVGS